MYFFFVGEILCWSFDTKGMLLNLPDANKIEGERAGFVLFFQDPISLFYLGFYWLKKRI